MNTLQTAPALNDAQQVLASAIAHHVETMTKDELQALTTRAHLELQSENAELKKRIKELEDDYNKLALQYSRSLFDEKDYENFDPSQFTVPAEELLAAIDQLKE
jgi:hypothetical protein